MGSLESVQPVSPGGAALAAQRSPGGAAAPAHLHAALNDECGDALRPSLWPRFGVHNQGACRTGQSLQHALGVNCNLWQCWQPEHSQRNTLPCKCMKAGECNHPDLPSSPEASLAMGPLVIHILDPFST